MSNIFSTATITTHLLPENIRTASRLAGLTAAPTGADHAAAVATLPGAQQVIATLAGEALTTNESPADFATRARDEMAQALAADYLRNTFGSAVKAAHERNLPATIDRAADDLVPAFTRGVKKLTDAAAHLDPETPLDPEKALSQDKGPHLIAARDALQALSVYARLHAHRPLDRARGLVPIVNILRIDGVVVEKAARHSGVDVQTLNPRDIDVTLAVRKLAADAENSVDNALIGVAAGRYNGVTLDLNDRAGLNATRRAVADTTRREMVTVTRDTAVISR